MLRKNSNDDGQPTVTFGPAKPKLQDKDWVEVTEQIKLAEEIIVTTREERLLKEKLNEKRVKEQKALIIEAKNVKFKNLLAVEEQRMNNILANSEQRQIYKKEQKNRDRAKSIRFAKLASTKPHKKTIVDPYGFNSKTRRFMTIGYHPSLEKSGCLRNNRMIGPGTYDPIYSGDSGSAVDWKNSLRTSVFSKTLGGQFPGLLAAREWDAGNIGPALYNVPDSGNLGELCQCSPLSNVGFSRAKRFTRKKSTATPGPGTYGVPQALLEANTPVRRVWTHLPPFEWSGYQDRCAYSKKRYHLPPNIYSVKDPGSIAEKVKHSVSKRGPYDLFTGPRDDSNIKGYLAPSSFKGSKTWPNDIPNNPRYADNPNAGKWAEGSRFETMPASRIMVTSLTLCRKDPDSPGPADYDPGPTGLLQKQSPGKHYPFNSSGVHARPLPPFRPQPGVGRYATRDPTKICPCTNGYQSAFKSKYKRGEWMYPETFNSF